MKKEPAYKPTEKVFRDYLEDTLSETDRIALEAWMDEDENNRTLIREIDRIWDSSTATRHFDQLDVSADWHRVKSRMMSSYQPPASQGIQHLWQTIGRIAAVILLAVALGFLIRYYIDSTPEMLVHRTGASVEEVFLADGSKITLNQNSYISYPKKFRGGERVVRLSGEAFFEIIRNKEQPFVVHTAQSTIRVLGTSFNVAEDSIGAKTTLYVASGKVAFYDSDDTTRRAIVAQNQKAVLTQDGLSSAPINDPNYLSWKTGLLEFNGSPLSEVVADLSKYYQKTIVIGDSLVNDFVFTSVVENQPLNDVLEEIKLVFSLEHVVKNDTIFIFQNQ